VKVERIEWPGQLVEDIYKKGIVGGLRDSIIELTAEAYQAFLADFLHSPVILSGEALHRLNCEYILQYGQAGGEISLKKSTFVLQSTQILDDFNAALQLIDNLTLFDTIVFLEEQSLIDQELVYDMHALRYLRNNAVHSSRKPRFDSYPSTARFDMKEIVTTALLGKVLSFEFRKHKMIIHGPRQAFEYVIDQEKLGIELGRVRAEQRSAIVALALLFAIMKRIEQAMPYSKSP